MIDLHCHILPGIDDGSKSIEESILMVQEAVKDGIHTIVATPHHRNGVYINEREDVLQYVALFNKRVKEEGLNVTILPGSEIHVYQDFVKDLKEGKLLTFNENNRYVFIEFPHDRIPINANQIIFEILVSGYIPIIPHPERNKEFQQDPDKLYQLVEQGALTQLTASSLLGLFGKNVQSFAEEIIEHNLAHVIASDSHGIGKRGVKLKESYQYIEDQFGRFVAEYYMDNAKRIIEGKDIYIETPDKIERKKGFFSFFSRKVTK